MAEQEPSISPELIRNAWNNCVLLGRLAIRKRSPDPMVFTLSGEGGHALLSPPAFLNEPGHQRDRMKYLWLPPSLLDVVPTRLLTHRVIIVPQTADEPPRRLVLEVNSSCAPFAGGMYINQLAGEIRLPAEQISADLTTISHIRRGDCVDAYPTIDPNQFEWE